MNGIFLGRLHGALFLAIAYGGQFQILFIHARAAMEGRRSGVILIPLDVGRAHVVVVVIETGVLARKLIRGDCGRKGSCKSFMMLEFFVLTASAV